MGVFKIICGSFLILFSIIMVCLVYTGIVILEEAETLGEVILAAVFGLIFLVFGIILIIKGIKLIKNNTKKKKTINYIKY